MTTHAILQHWRELAQRGDFARLAEESHRHITHAADAIDLTAARWHVLALRALGQGEAANAALAAAAKARFRAPLAEVAALTEELIQCAYYDEAAALLALLQDGAPATDPQAAYLAAALAREREAWAACDAALARLEQAPSPWPERAAIQRGWAWLRQGRVAAAAKLLAPYAQDPHPGTQKLLARLALAQGRAEEAVQRLQQVAAQQPLDWEWPPLLAAAWLPSLARSEPQRLLALFEQGLRRQPRQAEALFNRARLCAVLGQEAAARADSEAALALKPWFDAPVLFWVEQALARRDFARAQAELQAARARADTPRRAAAALDLLRLQGANRQALIAEAQALAARYPHEAQVLRTAGAALQSVGRLDEAARCYAQALALAPEDVATANNLAVLQKERGDLPEALATWQEVLPHAGPSVRLNYAWALLEHGEQQQAETLFREVLQREPNHPVALRGLAELFYRGELDDLAWQTMAKALQADPKHPLGWRIAAGICLRREGEAAALALLEQGEKQAVPALPVRQALFARLRAQGRYRELRRRLDAWCAEAPQEVQYWLMAADAAYDLGEFDACEAALRTAAQKDRTEGATALVRFYLRRDRQAEALDVAEELVRADPATIKHWGLLAEVLYRQERYEAALAALEEGLQREPNRLSLTRQKVGMLLARERFAEAIETARGLWAQDQRLPSLQLLLEAMQRAQRFEEAVRLLEQVLAERPGHRLVRLAYAQVLERAGRHDEALQTLAALYADEPTNEETARQWVRALARRERWAEAKAVIEQMMHHGGERPDRLLALVDVLQEQGALEAAQEILHRLLAAQPTHLPLWLQQVRLARRQQDEAEQRRLWHEIIERFAPERWLTRSAIDELVRLGLVQPLERALNRLREREPDSPRAFWAAFDAARAMKREPLALEMLAKIEARIGSAQPGTHARRAAILQECWQMGAAAAEMRRAIALRPDDAGLYQELLNILVKAGEFDEFDALMAKIEHLLGDRRYGSYANFFFNINCHPTWSAAQIWEFYRLWYERAVKPALPPPKPHANDPDPERRLRIGYLSPDFRRHAVAYFSEPLLAGHDREQFELFAYAHLEPGQADAYTERFRSYVHHWRETYGMSDDELERRIRADGIDILVDLAGHTANHRLWVMLRRPAPVQASWIFGSGQTTGLPQVDYLLCDPATVPPEHEPYVAEQVLRLPRFGLPFRPAHDVLEPAPLPCLERGVVTLGVLARPLRTNRQTVAVWAKILHAAPQARLRFDHVPYVEPEVQQRLLRYFDEHGIGPERLEFRNTRPHWQAYRDIDLQLDPFPAGSGTTATEGLYMERLVITLRARPPMGRVAHGQLAALGLDAACSAADEEEYVAKAVALIQDPARLAALSQGLRQRFERSWLMDYQAYGRAAAQLYRQMWRAWCRQQAAAVGGTQTP